MKIEEVVKVLDLIFDETVSDFIDYQIFEKDSADDSVSYLEITLYQNYEDYPIIKDLYFDKNTRELILNYDKKFALKKEIERLQKELKELE